LALNTPINQSISKFIVMINSWLILVYVNL